MKHNDYIFRGAGEQFTFLRRFEDMYRNCEDPHEQSAELRRADYQLVSTVLKKLIVGSGAHTNLLRILDVGCGLGYFTSHMKESFPDVTVCGCDISSTAVAKARVRAPNCNFFTADLRHPATFAKDPYHILVALEVLYYFTEHEIVGVIDNLRSLLIAGGYILAAYHLPETMNFGRYIQSLDDAKRLFESHGFAFRLTMDVVNGLDRMYSGAPVGRHIFFLAQKAGGGQGSE